MTSRLTDDDDDVDVDGDVDGDGGDVDIAGHVTDGGVHQCMLMPVYVLCLLW